MNELAKKACGLAGSMLMVAGSAAAWSTTAEASAEDVAATEAQAVAAGVTGYEKADRVEGTFAFVQGEVSPISAVARMSDAARYLCGSALRPEAGDVSAWTIAVGGAVERPYEVTVGELAKGGRGFSAVMGCSCAGNPADGIASVNAEVEGVSVLRLLEEAGVYEGANTVVFTCADGYEVALPLRYLAQRYCPIVFSVDGSPIADTMGGANQLWLGSTSARYFARDVVAVTVEEREVVPAAPQADGANVPNVGVDSAVESA